MTSLDHYLFLNSIIHFIVEREGVGWLDGWMVIRTLFPQKLLIIDHYTIEA